MVVVVAGPLLLSSEAGLAMLVELVPSDGLHVLCKPVLLIHIIYYSHVHDICNHIP